MSRPVSKEAERALRLIMRKKNPLTAYEAAQRVGITSSTIYRSPVYIKFMAGKLLESKEK